MCLQHKYQGQVVTINLLSKDKNPEANLRKVCVKVLFRNSRRCMAKVWGRMGIYSLI